MRYNFHMSNPIVRALVADVVRWRAAGYPAGDYSLIGEILRFQQTGESDSGELRFLRAAQFAALETYWYLRLVKNTPPIMDLYRDYCRKPHEFIKGLGVPLSAEEMFEVNNIDDIIVKIRNPEWAAKKKINAVHESAILEYPGYIFALAMGAGKTILIGAIVATEFAMAIHYRGRGDIRFMQNALIFAPGLTIIGSLREIGDMPVENILPPRLLRDYYGNVKLIYANQKSGNEIAADRGGVYNIIVINSEKIILRAADNVSRTINDEKQLKANLRLQKIISLPNLGVFSDEAHHTFGNKVTESLKRVRETVNYIHEKTPLVAVINTTGTPYTKGVLLPDVVCWYGLQDGIRDNVLKHLRDGIHSYGMTPDAEPEIIFDIIYNFYKRYKNTTLRDGARAKIAFYFKTQAHLQESKPHIERAMTQIGESVTGILVNTQQSSSQEVEEFERLNDAGSQKRVILLVQKGKEGWNCPSLFACALIKDMTSDIFVLQAATRCLRQTPGNLQGALVLLSTSNRDKLEKALQNNFGTGIIHLRGSETMPILVTLKIQKPQLPKLEITRTIERTERRRRDDAKIMLSKPKATPATEKIIVHVGSPDFDSWRILQPGMGEAIELPDNVVDCFSAAARLAANYHVPIMPILQQLQQFYPDGDIPSAHFAELVRQIEMQTADYVRTTEKIKEILALIRTLDRNGKPLPQDADGCYVHRLQFSPDIFEQMHKKGFVVAAKADEVSRDRYKQPILATVQNDQHDMSYHYTPYIFDSLPERNFFDTVLATLNTSAANIRAFCFTGLASDKITDFYFHYKGADGFYHAYFPDFILLKDNGEFFVVEIKAISERDNPIVAAKAKAVEELAQIPENRFRYAVIYADGKNMDGDGMQSLQQWIFDKNA